MFKFTAILAAIGHGIMAAAEKFEASAGGQTVAVDAGKTLSDAGSAALGLVQAGATQPAIDALTPGLTKIGIPPAVAGPLAVYTVSQGEAFLGQLAAKI